MNKKSLAKITRIAESLGWNVKVDGNEFQLGKYSPAGQDFNITITAENADKFIEELDEQYENFDVSAETYLWLDDFGHGAKGAPYDMKDLYEDMEACEKSILELHDALEKGMAKK